MKTGVSWLVMIVVAGAVAGCLGYRVGPTGGAVAGEKSIHVELFRNETDVPRLTAAVATSVRRALQQDGTFRLGNKESADVRLDGVIRSFTLNGLSYRRGDILTVRDYRAEIGVEVTAVEPHTGRTNLHRVLTGRTTLRFEDDLGNAIQQAMPRMADDVARKITFHLVDGDW